MNDEIAQSEPFLTWLAEWVASLPALSLADIKPETTALISEDLLKGFCTLGPLSSPRAQGIVPQVVALQDRGTSAARGSEGVHGTSS